VIGGVRVLAVVDRAALPPVVLLTDREQLEHGWHGNNTDLFRVCDRARRRSNGFVFFD